MIVYRVEDEEGNGCYRPPDEDKSFSHLIVVAGVEFSHDYRHPCPGEDSGLLGLDWGGPIERYRHGFSSMAQMRNWFYRDAVLKVLHDAGYKLAKYEMLEPEACRVGHTQVLFERERAVLIGRGLLLEGLR